MALKPLKTGKSGSVVTNDLGWSRIVQELGLINGSYTKIGFPEEGEVKNKRKKGSGHEEYEDISEISLIASWLEFGTKRIDPGWPFFRNSFDENIDELTRIRDKLYIKIVNGHMTTKTALGIMGEFMTNKIKRKMVEIKTPPNAPYTIYKKKGVNNPLIDTGQLVNSVQHVEVIK